MKQLLVINGPNLNLLGTREPDVYGAQTLEDIQAAVSERAATHGFGVDFRQSNHEGVIVDAIQDARGTMAGIIINPGALTHTSVALLDALQAVNLPFIEVHLSNIHAREDFRRHSYISPAASGIIAGLGAYGYTLAVDALVQLLNRQNTQTIPSGG
jgi:3-dehydroquinate dehydratase II